MRQYILTLSEEQAKCINHALDIYSRLKIGQLTMLTWELIDFKSGNIDETCARRDLANDLFRRTESVLFPDRMIPEDEQGNMAYDIHQVLRQKIAFAEHPEGGYGYVFDDPLPMSGHPLAVCEVKEVDPIGN